jgi:SAM-dependent methyltransferase
MKQELILENIRIDLDKPPSSIVKWGISNSVFLKNEKSEDKKLNILIAGCGTGRNAHYLSSLGHNVVGFDISKENINLANYRYSKRPLNANFNFFVHDLKDGLPFDNDTFDLIVDIFVYNEQDCIDTRQAYLREMSRVLSNDGCLLLGVHSSQDEYFLQFNSLGNTVPRVVYDFVLKKTILCYKDTDLLDEAKGIFKISMKWMQEKHQIIEEKQYLRKYLITLLKKI